MHRHKSGKGWRNVMKMKRILTGMLGAAILAAGVNLLSVQAAENAGVMEYIAATEYIEETEAAEPENAESLQLFGFICELAFDVFLKKQMIERLADELRAENPPKKKK